MKSMFLACSYISHGNFHLSLTTAYAITDNSSHFTEKKVEALTSLRSRS